MRGRRAGGRGSGFVSSVSELGRWRRGQGRAYRWDLEDDVHDEEKHNDDGIPVPSELEILVHACHGSETQVCAVDEGDGVHGSEDGEQASVYLLAGICQYNV